MASTPDYKPDHPMPEKIDSRMTTGTGLVDNVDHLNGELEQLDGEGTQSGSHPAKTQSKVMRYF